MKGETAIVQQFFAPLAADFSGAWGLLDDAATLSPQPGFDLVVTVDAVAEGVHFFADDAPADIGWKALAVNVSDLIGKGAVPHAYVMSLAFPEAPSVDWLGGFAAGLSAAQSAFGIALMGGDTDHKPGPLSVTITAFGLVPSGRMVRRGTAHNSDHILVSGALGCSALGLGLRAKTNPQWPTGLTAAHRDHLLRRYLRPNPPLALVAVLRDYASASMDISDGLVKDLGRMAKASGVGARIECRAIPLSAAARAMLEADPSLIEVIMTGGDDYQVLATASPGRVSAFQTQAALAGVIMTDIGQIVAGDGVVVIGADGNPVQFARPGYDHF